MAPLLPWDEFCECEDVQVSDGEYKSRVMQYICSQITSGVTWTSCLEYTLAPDPAVRFIRVFSRQIDGSVAFQDFDAITGEVIVVPELATIALCGE